jgi:hypothetical protein
MRLHLDRTTFAAVRLSRVFQLPERFLLLRVDRNRRLAAALPGLDSPGNVFELGVAIRMLFTL